MGLAELTRPQVVRHRVGVGVLRPADRGRVEASDPAGRHRRRARPAAGPAPGPRRTRPGAAGWCRPSPSHAESGRDQQPDRLRPAQLHRLGHRRRPAPPGRGQQPGIGTADRVRVARQGRGQQAVDGVQLVRGGRAPAAASSAASSVLPVRSAQSARSGPRGSGCPLPGWFGSTPSAEQQRDPVPAPGLDGPDQLVGQHLGRRLLGLAQPAPPRPAVASTQPVLEQQPEMVVAGLEHPVVQGLPVVGVGAGLEQQPGEGVARAGAAAGWPGPRRRRTPRSAR